MTATARARDQYTDLKFLCDEDLLALRSAPQPVLVDPLFEEIFRRYQTKVVSWCFAVTRNRDTAMDLAQEVFLKIYRNLSSFRGDSRVSTWIYAITRNHCLNSLRKQDAEPSGFAAQIPANLPGATGMEAHDALEKAQCFANIYRFIGSILTPLEVRILFLHYGNDLTLDAITRQLSLHNRSGAKAYIVSAKRKLKLYLHNRGFTETALSGKKHRLPVRVEYGSYAA